MDGTEFAWREGYVERGEAVMGRTLDNIEVEVGDGCGGRRRFDLKAYAKLQPARTAEIEERMGGRRDPDSRERSMGSAMMFMRRVRAEAG